MVVLGLQCMRLVVTSADRVGMSREILAVIADHQWNIKATEIVRHLTYVHLDQPDLATEKVIELIHTIDGVTECQEIKWLPSEQREQHLQAMLARIPDPIIDVDGIGQILAMNPAARNVFELTEQQLSYTNICTLLSLPENFSFEKEFSMSLVIEKGTYVVDVHPVSDVSNISGAVVTMRAMNKIGRDLSLVQAKNQEGLAEIIGDSAAIKAVKAQTKKYAELDLPVIITGETGTGKELLARAIHFASRRAESPFLAVNCAALPEHLLESELFGYDSGAFTGAKKGGKPGLIELAQNGTVFLDEVAEMSPYLQAKLLRFLQDYRYRRIGGTKERKADIRIISATHQNLTNLIEQKQFREDLYYRINVLNLQLPPLRERQQDITLLANHFIQTAAQQTDLPAPRLTGEAISYLEGFKWPGNVRQLQNSLFRVVALAESAFISKTELADIMDQLQLCNSGLEVKKASSFTTAENWQAAQELFESQLLTDLYPDFPTTRKLADRLGVSHNKIAMKLRKYQIK